MPGLLPEDWIDQVRQANDIVDVVSEYIRLKPSGRGFFGLCPFHGEKTPSFHVEPERQIYHCFGCGEGGNVFSFVMAMERMDFVEAAKHLAARSGIPVPEQQADRTMAKVIRDEQERLCAMNRDAAHYFHQRLKEPAGKAAREYLVSRGLDEKTITAFGLGYAPAGWENIKQYLLSRGYAQEDLIKAGLLVRKERRAYDRFRDRVIFPIIDQRGQVTGFGGRTMGDEQPKYLNSSESPVFDKSRTLYGIHVVAKRRPLSHVIIVEGYMDVIALHQYGFPNAVASLGTSLTQEQARLIRRLAPEAYIAYDGDAAGQSAAMRGLDILRDAGVAVRVMRFPEGLDPDETLRKYGPAYFKKLQESAVSLVDFKLEQIGKEVDLSNAEGRVAFATRAAEVLATVDNVLERDVHIQRVSEKTGFQPGLLYQQLSLISKEKHPTTGKYRNEGKRHTNEQKKETALPSAFQRAERHLIQLMVRNESIAQRLIHEVDPRHIEDPTARCVARIIAELVTEGHAVHDASVMNRMDDPAIIRDFSRLMAEEIGHIDSPRYASDCAAQIRRRGLLQEMENIKREITRLEAENGADAEIYKEYMRKLSQISLELRR